MKFLSSTRFLVIYSGVLTIVFVVVVVSGFAGSPSKLKLKELTVQRINVVEPDGTPRMVISDKHDFPRNNPNRRTAGILFFNDEGTENGGLIFGGHKGKDGKPISYGHLSFDKYDQDQTLVMEASQTGHKYQKYFAISDRPDWPLSEVMPLVDKAHSDPTEENKAAVKKFFAKHGSGANRLILGEVPGRGVTLNMKDKQGRARVVLAVQPDGSPVLKFLDATGKVVMKLPETKKAKER